MTTQFITAEIALCDTPVEMHRAIELELQRWGEPLRWAVVGVNVAQQVAYVEAVVTICTDADSPQ